MVDAVDGGGMDTLRPRRRLLVAVTAAVLAAVAAPAPAAAAVDPLLGDQWALGDGLGAAGVGDAWAVSRGDGVTVAILDSGVDFDHPDLRGAPWVNAGEVAGNGRDDDANGHVDDVNGVNLVGSNGDPRDDEGHGTHVAGIVGARAGNGTGVAGVAPHARIMAVKVLDGRRAGDMHTLAAGIRYAVDEGASILNISVNGDGSTPELAAAARYATERGATIVASAGNNGRDLGAAPSYPASLPDAGILSVTAGDEGGLLWTLANRGAQAVDLAAPGERIVSTALGSGYEHRSGTSMAAPHTAGALALLAAARPDLSQAQLRDALLQTARRSASLLDRLGAGGLDAGAAMRRLRPDGRYGAVADAPSAATTTGAAQPRVRLHARSTRAGRRAELRWRTTGTSSVRRWHVSLDGRRVATLGRRAERVVRRRVGRAGRHRWRVIGLDATGHRVVSASRSFRATARR